MTMMIIKYRIISKKKYFYKSGTDEDFEELDRPGSIEERCHPNT